MMKTGAMAVKRILLGTTTLCATSLLATAAMASDGVKLSLGGYITNAIGVAFDDDDAGEAGDDQNAVGVGTDAEIYFLGSVTLDNGVTVGARFDLEGGDENNDQIDQAYAFFRGGFGDVRIGSQTGVAGNMYMLPPGSTANFGPYSPNTTGAAVSPGVFDIEGMEANQDKSQKLVYYSPEFGGFTFGVAFTPNDDEKDYNNGDNADGEWRANSQAGNADNNIGLGAHFTHEGDGWGVDVGAAAYLEGDVQEEGADETEQSGYNAGVNLAFGGFTVGVAGTYLADSTITGASSDGENTWVIGTGLSYNVDAWTIGAGWSHVVGEVEGTNAKDHIDRVGVTGNYAMGPGIDLDAGVFYTWANAADEGAATDDSFNSFNDNNYDAIEFAVGSSITF
ncbi:porin [Dongia sp.]|uniref:porin n=1 Tax=Dongia sp. TaxID=1977262 RepID=UPI0035AE5FCC